MVTKILRKKREFDPRELRREQNSTRDKQKIVARALCKHNLQALSERVDLPKNLKRAIELASEPGASGWLTARPLTTHETVLTRVSLGMR